LGASSEYLICRLPPYHQEILIMGTPQEIVAALNSNCNIIPIMDQHFDWPEVERLPEDMRSVAHFNGVSWIHDYQDACIDKLERYIKRRI